MIENQIILKINRKQFESLSLINQQSQIIHKINRL